MTDDAEKPTPVAEPRGVEAALVPSDDVAEKDTDNCASGLAALFTDYRVEQQENRNQDKIAESSRSFRERLTLCFLVLTTAGVFIQAWIFHSTDVAVHESYTKTQRPFITVRPLTGELRYGLRALEVGKLGVPERYWAFIPNFENSGNTLTKNLEIYSMATGISISGATIFYGQSFTMEDNFDPKRGPPDPEETITSGKPLPSAANHVAVSSGRRTKFCRKLRACGQQRLFGMSYRTGARPALGRQRGPPRTFL